MAERSDTANHLRTILIGVTTTVLGTAAIYYLGFRPKSGGSSAEELLVMKDVTISAWKNYISAENVFTTNWKIVSAEYSKGDLQHSKEHILEEFDNLNIKIKNLRDQSGIDKILASLFDQELAMYKKWTPKYEEYFNNVNHINSDNSLTQDEKNKKLKDELSGFNNEINSTNLRFQNEVRDVCRTLTNKYNYNFLETDFLKYQTTNNGGNTRDTTRTNTDGNQGGTDRQMLVGNWMIGDSWYIYQYNDGRLYMYFKRNGNLDSVYGRWELKNNQLYQYSDQYFSAGTQWVYNLSNITPNSFVMTLTVSPYTQFTVQRRTNMNNSTSSEVNRQMLVGKWKVVNDYMYQYDDGRFYLYRGNGDSVYGTWNINNNMLYLNYGNFGNSATSLFIYKISNQTYQSFTAQSIDSTRYTFVANRVNQ
jgi:hypothetical protein